MSDETQQPNNKSVIIGFVVLLAVVAGIGVFQSSKNGSFLEKEPGAIRSFAINGTKFDFAWCPSGTFIMGSSDWESGRGDDEVRHQVTLTDGFWMGTTEVTQGQWASVMNGETLDDVFRKALQDNHEYAFGGNKTTWRDYKKFDRNTNPRDWCCDKIDDIPVYYVGWNEAARFCSVLTEHERAAGRLPDGYEYRLPTEAEWEYACRAETTSTLPNGRELSIVGKNNAPDLDQIAWYGGNSSSGFSGQGWDTKEWPEKQYRGGLAATRIVAQKQPNNWGLYDMIGNVWEWTNDRYDSYPSYNVRNPTGGDRGELRVIRGGSWDSIPRVCRSAYRGREWAGNRCRNLGFRIALAPILVP